MTYREAVLGTPNLVAYWLFGVVPPVVPISQVSAFTAGTYDGAPTVAGALVANHFASGLAFDGVNQGVLFGDNFGFEGRQPMSFELWIQVAAVSAASFLRVMAKEVLNTGIRDGWFVYILPVSSGANAGKVVFQRNLANVSDGATTASVALTLNAPNHVVGTFNGTSKIVWVNGAASTPNGTGSELIDNDGQFVLARASNGGDYIPATMSNVALYARPLDGGEVATHYLLGLLPPKFDAMRWNQGLMVTPSDTLDGPFAGAGTPFGNFTGLMVGGAGNVAVVAPNDVVTTFTAVPARAVLPITGRRVNATGTTATGIGAYRRV